MMELVDKGMKTSYWKHGKYLKENMEVIKRIK